MKLCPFLDDKKDELAIRNRGFGLRNGRSTS